MTILATMAALADPESVRRKAIEVVSRPEFDLSPSSDAPLNLGLRILMWILKPIGWLFAALGDISLPLKIVIVSVLVLVLAALITHIVYTFIRAFQGPVRKRHALVADRPLQPEAFEATARRRAREGDFIGAIRALFKAALLRIEQSETKPLRRGITNREILKRYRSSRLFEPLGKFIEMIDSRWYGYTPCEQLDFAICESEYERIRSVLEGRPNAVHP